MVGLINKLYILYRAVYGLFIKVWYSIFFFNRHDVLNTTPREIPVIVSLTSYGRRVSKTLPFTLISLLRQKFKPDKIIVWLDYDHWNLENLPNKLRVLQKSGVEFRFCEDIRSYKKLVPTLLEFPDAIIITTDDDVFYRSSLIYDLYNSYLKYPDRIHTAVAHQPKRNENGELAKYSHWNYDINVFNSEEVFPTGVGGCLYPPDSLYKDTVNKELFLKLCPTTDDIWFWVMAKLQSTRHMIVKTKKYFLTDIFYETTHQGSALRHENVHGSANDVQLKQVLDYYSLK